MVKKSPTDGTNFGWDHKKFSVLDLVLMDGRDFKVILIKAVLRLFKGWNDFTFSISTNQKHPFGFIILKCRKIRFSVDIYRQSPTFFMFNLNPFLVLNYKYGNFCRSATFVILRHRHHFGHRLHKPQMYVTSLSSILYWNNSDIISTTERWRDLNPPKQSEDCHQSTPLPPSHHGWVNLTVISPSSWTFIF